MKWRTRFWEFVDRRKESECWPWTGARWPKGYGLLNTQDGRRAHRLSWLLHNGSIPSGMCVLHRCDNPPCVNPAHIYLGTPSQNTRDRDAKGRAACGERHGRAKLTSIAVHEIRAAFAQGVRPPVLARKYGVHRVTVVAIASRKLWSHLTEVAL